MLAGSFEDGIDKTWAIRTKDPGDAQDQRRWIRLQDLPFTFHVLIRRRC